MLEKLSGDGVRETCGWFRSFNVGGQLEEVYGNLGKKVLVGPVTKELVAPEIL